MPPRHGSLTVDYRGDAQLFVDVSVEPRPLLLAGGGVNGALSPANLALLSKNGFEILFSIAMQN